MEKQRILLRTASQGKNEKVEIMHLLTCELAEYEQQTLSASKKEENGAPSSLSQHATQVLLKAIAHILQKLKSSDS
jgi:hypothetical protein